MKTTTAGGRGTLVNRSVGAPFKAGRGHAVLSIIGLERCTFNIVGSSILTKEAGNNV